jgi:acid phosphatase (class A)
MTTPKERVQIFGHACVYWFALWLLFLAVAPLQAAPDRYLTNARTEVLALLAPPPRTGSDEQAADLASVTAVHQAATTNDLITGKSEGDFSVFVFTPALGNFFQPGKFPKTEAFFQRVRRDSDHLVNLGKNHRQRLRPINASPSLNWGLQDQSYSYPSGHSTRGTIYALLLAEIFPDRSEGIMATGRSLGWHRVQMAEHYPTDIYAGRVLAQAIVRELKSNPEFQHDFAEVKTELQAADKL